MASAPRTLVNQGTQDDVTWKIFTGPATNDSLCVMVEVVPPPAVGRGPSCSPAPSSTSYKSQPLYSSIVSQDGARSPYHYVAGLAAPEIDEIHIEFGDGSTDVTHAVGGTFFLLFPTTKRIAAIRPLVPAFPDLRCEVRALEGPPDQYADGGCRGYTFRVPARR